MSSNDGIWLMLYKGLYHVWYCFCVDNEPERPDEAGEEYRRFRKKENAINYAQDLIRKFTELGVLIEYGIMEV